MTGTENNPTPVQTVRSDWDPYALPAIVPPPADHPDAEQWMANEKRTRVVAALRALATFIEDNPQLPVPNSVSAQYSYLDNADRSTRLALVAAAAEHMGVEQVVSDSHASTERMFGGKYSGFRYVVFTRLPEPTTAEVVSAALEA